MISHTWLWRSHSQSPAGEGDAGVIEYKFRAKMAGVCLTTRSEHCDRARTSALSTLTRSGSPSSCTCEPKRGAGSYENKCPQVSKARHHGVGISTNVERTPARLSASAKKTTLDKQGMGEQQAGIHLNTRLRDDKVRARLRCQSTQRFAPGAGIALLIGHGPGSLRSGHVSMRCQIVVDELRRRLFGAVGVWHTGRKSELKTKLQTEYSKLLRRTASLHCGTQPTIFRVLACFAPTGAGKTAVNIMSLCMWFISRRAGRSQRHHNVRRRARKSEPKAPKVPSSLPLV